MRRKVSGPGYLYPEAMKFVVVLSIPLRLVSVYADVYLLLRRHESMPLGQRAAKGDTAAHHSIWLPALWHILTISPILTAAAI